MVTETKCKHYWIIEEPYGTTSRGKCKLCGEEKDFYNAYQSKAVDYINHTESRKLKSRKEELVE